mmetsp:Transcript_5205/g.13429  ORF Transcript_5205/g.13429 Transcript_5205/m.13429 type:complete len:224 (-) Transcript_5205:736-1407(-)
MEHARRVERAVQQLACVGRGRHAAGDRRGGAGVHWAAVGLRLRAAAEAGRVRLADGSRGVDGMRVQGAAAADADCAIRLAVLGLEDGIDGVGIDIRTNTRAAGLAVEGVATELARLLMVAVVVVRIRLATRTRAAAHQDTHPHHRDEQQHDDDDDAVPHTRAPQKLVAHPLQRIGVLRAVVAASARLGPGLPRRRPRCAVDDRQVGGAHDGVLHGVEHLALGG